jgi:hypothetical protein
MIFWEFDDFMILFGGILEFLAGNFWRVVGPLGFLLVHCGHLKKGMKPGFFLQFYRTTFKPLPLKLLIRTIRCVLQKSNKPNEKPCGLDCYRNSFELGTKSRLF